VIRLVVVVRLLLLRFPRIIRIPGRFLALLVSGRPVLLRLVLLSRVLLSLVLSGLTGVLLCAVRVLGGYSALSTVRLCGLSAITLRRPRAIVFR
jgi:hypothetical protein